MYQLVYHSSEAYPLSAEDIEDILNKAREFNAKHQITGCLLYHEHEFLQILEGEKETIQALYQKIKTDNRHTDLIILSENKCSQRLCSDWSMAYFPLNKKEIKGLEHELRLHNFLSFSKLIEKPTLAVKLFWRMAKVILEES